MTQEKRDEPRVRSKGQVTIWPPGAPGLSASVQDIAVSGLGLLAERALPAGTAVQIESHGYTAQGVVRHCRPAGESFLIGIALESGAGSWESGG